MKVILFGATGMVGTGVLREALADLDVEAVLYVGRRSCGLQHPKLKEALTPDLFDLSPVEDQLRGYDACVWALGVSSVGMKEEEYRRLTRTLTVSSAQTLLRLNPGLSFCYCSAAGAGGSSMWARVRQEVEADLKALPFKHVGCVRPAGIAPGPGIRSRVALYNAFLVLLGWLLPWLVRHYPGFATSSERLGRAMLRVCKGQAPQYILESADINALGA